MAETTPKKKFDDGELKERLDALQYQVTQHAGTERAFTGVYWDCHDEGTYRCIVCDEPLFDSDTKYESGSGWPRNALKPHWMQSARCVPRPTNSMRHLPTSRRPR